MGLHVFVEQMRLAAMTMMMTTDNTNDSGDDKMTINDNHDQHNNDTWQSICSSCANQKCNPMIKPVTKSSHSIFDLDLKGSTLAK